MPSLVLSEVEGAWDDPVRTFHGSELLPEENNRVRGAGQEPGTKEAMAR